MLKICINMFQCFSVILSNEMYIYLKNRLSPFFISDFITGKLPVYWFPFLIMHYNLQLHSAMQSITAEYLRQKCGSCNAQMLNTRLSNKRKCSAKEVIDYVKSPN